MKTALSLAAVLALGCASAALAQSERYGSPYDQPQSGQYQDQNEPQNDQYQNDQNSNGPNGQTNPGYGNAPNGQYDQNGQYGNSGPMNGPANLDRDDVRRLQLTLRHAGYDPGRADGNWGQQTASALADFQRANGIEPTGNLDKRTARALGLPPDQGYGGERNGQYGQHDYGQFGNGQYGNELNDPDTDDYNNMNNNNPGPNPQNPSGNDQYNPH